MCPTTRPFNAATNDSNIPHRWLSARRRCGTPHRRRMRPVHLTNRRFVPGLLVANLNRGYSSDHRPRCLDRYAARYANFVLVVTRIAVLGARSAPRDTGNQPRALRDIKGRALGWLPQQLAAARSDS